MYCDSLVQALRRDGWTTFQCFGRREDNSPCPNIINVDNLTPDVATHNLLGQKKVRCTNSHAGCNAIVTWNNLQQHLTYECGYKLDSYAQCTENYQQQELLCQNELTGAGVTPATSNTQRSLGFHIGSLYQHLATEYASLLCTRDSIKDALSAQLGMIAGKPLVTVLCVH